MIKLTLVGLTTHSCSMVAGCRSMILERMSGWRKYWKTLMKYASAMNGLSGLMKGIGTF